MRSQLQLIIPSKRIARELDRFRLHFARCLAGGKYVITEQGLIIDGAVRAFGQYFHRKRGTNDCFVFDPNLVVDQGLQTMLATSLGSAAKLPKFYMALTTGTTAPVPGLTAANFTATQNELVSQSEGYTSPTRPQWVPSEPVAGVISNAASEASFTFATGTSVTVTGAALLSDNGRGSTAGVLISASKWANGRQMFDGETLDVGYQVSLTD